MKRLLILTGAVLGLLVPAFSQVFQINIDPGVDLARTINVLENNSVLTIQPGLWRVGTSNNIGSGDPLAAPIRIIGRTNVVISGSGLGTTFLATNTGQVFMVLSNCQNVTLKDFVVDGAWSNYRSNGLNGIMGAIELAGSNQFVRVQNVRFQNVGGFAVWLGSRAGPVDRHFAFQMLDCSGVNLGVTNNGGYGGSTADGGAFCGGGDDLLISRLHVTDSIKMVELFPSVPATNTTIVDCTGEGNSYGLLIGLPTAASVTGVQVSNLSLKGGTNHPLSSMPALYGQDGIMLSDGAYNVGINNSQMHGLKARAVYFNAISGMISNVTIDGLTVADGGTQGLSQGGILLTDPAGGPTIDTVAIRNCQFINLVNQAIYVAGCRRLTVENDSFIDCGLGGVAEAIGLVSSLDLTTNVVIRNNLFQNFGNNRALYAVNVAAGVMNVRILDNVITNMVSGAISDSGGSTTVVGEPFTYSVVTNLGSFASGSSSNIFIPALLARSDWRADVMIPSGFFGVSGGNDVVTTAFCTNGLVVVNVRNNGAGTFDPPSATIRATIRATGAY